MGLLKWLWGRKARRRAAILAEPFPAEWGQILTRQVPWYPVLAEEARARLHDLVRIFLAEKRITTGRDVSATDEMRVTIAGNACLLLLGRPDLDVFPRLAEVLVAQSTIVETVDAVGPTGRVYRIHDMRSGEAWKGGPVRLAWDSVRRSVARPSDGYNVILHEFAHVIDMMNVDADGIPPMRDGRQYADWQRVFMSEFRRHVEADRRGARTFIDPYGAESEGEFFAVVTEHFFEQPLALEGKHPELFRILLEYYQVDPREWAGRAGEAWASLRNMWRGRGRSGA